jgi:Ca2+-binding EF-hand superfamily protein
MRISHSCHSFPHQFGSRQQTFKKNRNKFFRGSSNGKLSRPTTNNKVVHRLSPLKENSPSRPKPQPASDDHLDREASSGRHYQYHTRSVNHNNNNNKLASPPPIGFSQAEIHDLQESFRLFDIDNTGSIQVGDLVAILQTLKSEQEQQQQQENQQSYPYPHLDKLLRRLQSFDAEDLLTLDDYMNLMESTTITSAMANEAVESEYYGDGQQQQNYVHVFRLFDLDGKGYIDLQDLQRVALELGEHDMTHDELHEMMERAANSKGKVSLEDFTRMMTMNLFPRTAAASASATAES